MQQRPENAPWSDREIDLVVADYFDMRRCEFAGVKYVKLHRNIELQRLTGRSAGSIEFKRQNISAVLDLIGEPWMPGFKPMANFQKSLLAGVERFLDDKGKLFLDVMPLEGAKSFQDSPQLYIEAPPIAGVKDEKLPEELVRIIRKFDPADRDARNRELGRMGEEIAFRSEQQRLRASDRADLARKIVWVSEERGDGAGYDIHSFNEDGSDRLIEVKSTRGHSRTPFYLSRNECAVSEERPDAFRLLRLFDLAREPRAFELQPPLSDNLELVAHTFLANLR